MVASTAMIIPKHIDFNPVIAEPNHPSRDTDGYPLDGIDEVPSSVNAE